MASRVVAQRRAQYKQALSGAKGRQARLESNIQVRKNKRLESLQKRRAVGTTAKAGFDATTQARTLPETIELEHLPLYVEAIRSADEARQLEGIHSVRKLLSRECLPPVDAVLECGILPRIVELMGTSTNKELLFEGAWALTNIASTEHTAMIVELRALPVLANLLLHGDENVREQSIWCVGNVAGDGHKCRDAVLNTPGVLENVVRNIQEPASSSLLRNATWALSNCFRGKPAPAMDRVRPLIPVLAYLLNQEDKEVLADACWGFSYFTDGDDSRVRAVVEASAVPSLVRALRHESVSVVIPALRTIGNVVTGSDVHTQAAVDARVLEALVPLIEHGKRNIRREACWAVSNVAAGTPEQISRLVATPGLLPALMTQLQRGDFNVRKEACWAICNVATTGSSRDIQALVAAGALTQLVSLMRAEDPRVVQIVLEALEQIFDLGVELEERGQSPGATEYYQVFEEAGGTDVLGELQDHPDEETYKKTMRLVKKHFDGDDENGDDVPTAGENSAPAIAAPGFGAPSSSPSKAPAGATTSTFGTGGFGGFGAAAGGFSFSGMQFR